MKAALVVCVLAGLIACSSASAPGPSCACTVVASSETRVVPCGTSACVGGLTYTCDPQGNASQAGACTVETPGGVDAAAGPPPECTDASQCPSLTCTCSSLPIAFVQTCLQGVCVKQCSEVSGCS